jgi:carbonic anhydrase/acetyltransferase-like protein (isoleucine patch superfamily)
MILSSGAKRPKIHATAYVAPSATIAGEVTIEAECAVLHGAVITAEGAPVTIGANCVIMENAVLKAGGASALQRPLTIGERCIVGPHAYVVDATIGNGCTLGAGAKIFGGAELEDGKSVAPSEIVAGERLRPEGAETYAAFLRKTHAGDSVVEEHRNVKPPPRRSGEEPPQTQSTQVDKVVDVMMLELEEMEHRRQQAIKKQRGD